MAIGDKGKAIKKMKANMYKKLANKKNSKNKNNFKNVKNART
jgi:hypothetical protein